jgi:nitronate monooxygenase
LVEGKGDDTLRTTVFDVVRKIDWPKPFTGRALANDFLRQWHGREAELVERQAEENKRYLAAAAKGDVDTTVVWAGEAIDLIDRIEPAESILTRLVAEAEQQIRRTAAQLA